jgi:cholesterol transport system auxiliary component
MHRNREWFVLLLLLSMTSCASIKQPSLKIDHYTLEYGPPKPGDLPQLPVILKVERFSISPLYDTRQIVYRDRSFKRETYTYHRWRAHPTDLVTDYLARDMRHSGLFRAVLEEGSKVSPAYILEGSLDEFFEWDSAEGWKAVLTVTATLIKARETDAAKKILFQRTFHAIQPCQEKTPKALAEAMSEAMSRLSGEVIRAVYEQLSVVNRP